MCFIKNKNIFESFEHAYKFCCSLNVAKKMLVSGHKPVQPVFNFQEGTSLVHFSSFHPSYEISENLEIVCIPQTVSFSVSRYLVYFSIFTHLVSKSLFPCFFSQFITYLLLYYEPYLRIKNVRLWDLSVMSSCFCYHMLNHTSKFAREFRKFYMLEQFQYLFAQRWLFEKFCPDFLVRSYWVLHVSIGKRRFLRRVLLRP